MAGAFTFPGDGAPAPEIDQEFLFEMQTELRRLSLRLNSNPTLDMAFLVFLRRMSRFGFFQFGPIVVDVNLIEAVVERSLEGRINYVPGHTVYEESIGRFLRGLIEEVKRSGRSRIDDLHFLLTFMRISEGLPARVFGELGVTPEQIEQYVRTRTRTDAQSLEKLYSPEEAAEYLGVHVQTVRAWIRSGRLPASRLTGQRSLRIRAGDLQSVLEPVEPGSELH